MTLTVTELQKRLTACGAYKGRLDGDFGPVSTCALMAAFQRPDPTPRASSSARIAAGVPLDFVGMRDRRPVIYFDPAAFRQLSGRDSPLKIAHVRELDGQRTEWRKLAEACESDPQAAFEATRWGLCRTPGTRWADAGYTSVWAFARAHMGGECAHIRIAATL